MIILITLKQYTETEVTQKINLHLLKQISNGAKMLYLKKAKII